HRPLRSGRTIRIGRPRDLRGGSGAARLLIMIAPLMTAWRRHVVDLRRPLDWSTCNAVVAPGDEIEQVIAAAALDLSASSGAALEPDGAQLADEIGRHRTLGGIRITEPGVDSA